ncbi:MAG: hypothetical protein JW955_21645 [Sedimentisphaerales bacterium]|nr:hypothetical protein [Sedimentisphaerales bacterium]
MKDTEVLARAAPQPDVCGIRLCVQQANRIAQQACADTGMRETAYRIHENLSA